MGCLRFLTAGASHGPALAATIEEIPAGLPLTADETAVDLTRRQRGYGRGTRSTAIEHSLLALCRLLIETIKRLEELETIDSPPA